MSQYDFGIIMPCYNYASELPKSLEKIRQWRAKNKLNFVFCIVDDGSSDSTLATAQTFQKEHADWCQVHSLAQNQGKGKAIRAGAALVCDLAPFIMFTDCDLHYGLSIVHERILPALKEGSDIVILDRSWNKQFHSNSAIRRFLSRGFNHLKTILTGVPYEDSQAGLKGFRSEFLRGTLLISQINGFAFDVELLSIAIHFRLRVERIPILLNSKLSASQTSVTLRKAVTMFFDLLRIALNRYSGAYSSDFLDKLVEKRVYEINEESF